jgi:hypothetical protein
MSEIPAGIPQIPGEDAPEGFGTFTISIILSPYFVIMSFYYTLRNKQSQSCTSIGVSTKLCEKARQYFSIYTSSSIFYTDYNLQSLRPIGNNMNIKNCPVAWRGKTAG